MLPTIRGTANAHGVAVGRNVNASKKRLVDMGPGLVATPWGPHDPEACDSCDQAQYTLAVSEGHIITIRHQECRGLMLDFALMHHVTIDGVPVEVIRVDCKHSEVHVHRFDAMGNQTSREVLLPISCEDDVESGYALAETIILEGWATNAERSGHGR
jgi:hypothetical protein